MRPDIPCDRVLPATLALPPLTLTGRGAVGELLCRCAAFGRRGLLVVGSSVERSGILQGLLDRTPSELTLRVHRHAGGEPTLAQLEQLLTAARAFAPDWVAAIGGGSVLDLAKAGAGLLRAPKSPVAYHDGEPVDPSGLPFAAVPTTAGTGSEATPVSVLTHAARGLKKSIRHPSFLARLVILDPTLLAGCPATVMADAGMDAFTQAVESYFSRGATAWTADLSRRAALLVARALPVACGARRAPAGSGQTAGPDGDLLVGSYLAGVALAHARLGLVHGLAHPLGARFGQPHGRVCAVCLPPVLGFNREAARERYDALSAALGTDLVQLTDALLRRLEMTSPFAGVRLEGREGIIEETLTSGSTAANPRPVSAADVAAVLDRLFA